MAKATTSVLDREMYTEAGAARLLDVAPATLHYWLEGGRRGNKTYKPVIREDATGNRTVTWAEFIEAGLLRQYRRVHNVPMIELRVFIDRLRQTVGVPYPLAHYRPFIGDKKLLVEAQADAGLTGEFALVAMVSGQYVLATPAQNFVERVTWHNDVAAAWRPASDSKSPVIIDPDVRFGQPSVGGISTEVLHEQADAGEEPGALAEIYGLTINQVRWALSFELAVQAA